MNPGKINSEHKDRSYPLWQELWTGVGIHSIFESFLICYKTLLFTNNLLSLKAGIGEVINLEVKKI